MSTRAPRGEIHLGDLARALATLRWDDAQATTMASCLGFGLQPEARPHAPTEIYDRQRYRRPAPTSAPPPASRPVSVPPVHEPPPDLPAITKSSSLQTLPQRAAPTGAPEWLDEPRAVFVEEPGVPLAREPLLPELTHRHVLAAALATLRSGHEVDVPSLIAAICDCAAIADLPRRAEATVELGCELLLDYSATMMPYWEDLGSLIDQVVGVVGKGAVDVFSFDTHPTEAVRWTARGDREAWRPQRRPVLAATDFGIRGRTGRAAPDPAWRDLARRCEREHIPLIVLVPWPEHRWPSDIGGCPQLVHWSPHTTAAMIRRAIGPGHRLG